MRQETSAASVTDTTRSFTSVFPALAAGALAGAIAKTTIAPLDRTKINFQVTPSRHYSFKAALRFVILTYRENGFVALFRGNSASLARIVPYAAVQFASHEEFCHLLKVDKNGPTPYRRFLAGALAGVTAVMCTYPLDTAKVRLSVSTKQEYRNLRAVFLKECRAHGFLTFYRGISPTLLGVIPYAGLAFFTYESCKLIYTQETDKPLNPLLRMAFGAFAGVVGQVSSYPLDIVRRRMQTGRMPARQGILLTLFDIWLYEGVIRGLYKGISMNWVKGPIAAGISFTTYDMFFERLKRWTGRMVA
uniref:Mitochondrial coenzyme A transporter SLC25A42 n=1 Tax=Globodera pallida TaxID=36090 RepID=A0A183C9C4_GLOPA